MPGYGTMGQQQDQPEGMLPFGGASEVPGTQMAPPPDMSVPDAMPTSSLGDEIAPGQKIPEQEMHHARMRGYDQSAEAHRAAAAANADAMASLDVNDPDYYKKVLKLNTQQNDLHVAHGEIQRAKAEEAQANPWGTMGNHPGIAGKIGHVFGVIGNVAGNAMLGEGNMAGIPGSQANLKEKAAEGEGEENQATKNNLEVAQTGALGDKEDAGDYVQPQGPDGKPLMHNGQPVYINKKNPTDVKVGGLAGGGAFDPAAPDPKSAPIGPEGVTQHTNQLNVLTQGMTPEQAKDFNTAYGVKPTDPAPVVQKRLEDAKAAAAMTGSERDRQLTRDQMQRNHVEAMAAAADARSANEEHKGTADKIKARQEVAKIYADPMSSAERFNVMTSSLHDALANHDQQAMLNLLTNHIGMTMGLQKGARITQAILEEAQKSQPWLANMKAKFDKDGYLSGVNLGPDQMKSMVNLARGRYKEDVVKARNLAKYAGAEDDGPDRTPGEATMHYYLDVAKGDVNKAKSLAADDGWTVR